MALFLSAMMVATTDVPKTGALSNQINLDVDREVVSESGDSDFQEGREFLNQAWNALERGNKELAIISFAVAEEHFSEFLKNFPEDIPTLMNRATAYIGLEEYELSLADFDTTLELNPVYAPAFEGKSLAYYMMGDIEQSQEMLEVADTIYEALTSQDAGNTDPAQPAPNSPYQTFYASTARHNYTNRFSGQTTLNASGFGCGVTQPWKTNVENAVYFYLPSITWGRTTEGFKCTGLCNWVNLNGNTQGYTNVPPFQGWTVPAGENYVLLIAETEVCAAFWIPLPSKFRVSAYFN